MAVAWYAAVARFATRRSLSTVAVGGSTFGDPRNESIEIYMNTTGSSGGRFVPRREAMVSVFDSGFILGDGVWEGLRLYNKCWFQLDEHLARLYEACKFLDIDIGISPTDLSADLYRLVERNSMVSGVHARLMVTRGEKYTPYQGPSVNIGPPTIVGIAEHKPKGDPDRGLRLFTVHVRRGYADSQDQKLNSHSKINCVTACIAAAKAGADEALMLDPHGQVATCNSTHFFIVKNGEVLTSGGNYCIPGITRGNIIELCKENGIPVRECDFSPVPGAPSSNAPSPPQLCAQLFEVYGAEEAFVTGTFSGITPVREVDGRTIGVGLARNWGEPAAAEFTPGPMVRRLRELYLDKVRAECGGL